MVLEHPAVVRLFKIRYFEFEFTLLRRTGTNPQRSSPWLTRTTRSVSPNAVGERLFDNVGPRFEEIEAELAALEPASSTRANSACCHAGPRKRGAT